MANPYLWLYTPAVMEAKCDVCKGGPGVRCKDGFGRDIAPHVNRRRRAIQLRVEGTIGEEVIDDE